MNSTNQSEQPRALVIGGSLGGLFAGNVLRSSGWRVDIYERSPRDLDSRGGGIVLQPEVTEMFRRSGMDIDRVDLGVRSMHRTVLDPDGSIRSKSLAPQTQTSWSLIYTTMQRAFGDDHYHRGKELIDIRQDTARGQVTARFRDGSEATGDLLIGADGSGSSVRQLMWPEAEPTYAGYLAWRGLVPEDRMSAAARLDLHGDFGFAGNRGSHILGYLVPGANNDTRAGHRLYNWVWYRVAGVDQLQQIMTDADGRNRGFSLPEGKLAPAWRTHVRDEAERLLPPAFREVVHATHEPFAQAIRDLTVDSMVKGRVILLGDAAFIPRPHTAASTSKAAANALALGQALDRFPTNVERALAHWEPRQLALGNTLYEQGSRTGDFLLFDKPWLDRAI